MTLFSETPPTETADRTAIGAVLERIERSLGNNPLATVFRRIADPAPAFDGRLRAGRRSLVLTPPAMPDLLKKGN